MNVLFLDRDGTIIREPADYRIDRLDKISLLPGVITALRALSQAGYRLVLVSNQDGLGRPEFPQADFDGPHRFLMALLAGEGVLFDAEFIDGHYAQEQHPNRKPGTGMLLPYLAANPVNLAGSYVIGDRKTDAWLAHNLGCGSLTIKDPQSADGDLRQPDVPDYPTQRFTHWADLAAHLLARAV